MKDNLVEIQDNFVKYKNIKSVLKMGDSSLTKPLFSIIIPTFKRANLLKFAIDSALYQKKSKEYNYEVIVVDNDDQLDQNTIDLINSYHDDKLLYYVNEKNIGMFGNINRGAELSRGKWLVYLHDDDMLANDYFEKITHILKQKTDADCILSHYQIIRHDNGEPPDVLKEKKHFENKFHRPSIYESIIFDANIFNAPSCGFLLKREKFLEFGGYDENYYPSADWFFIANFSIKHKVYKPFVILGFYRFLLNESLNINTIINFFKQRQQFRNCLIKKYFIAKIFSALFHKELDYIAYKKNLKSINNDEEKQLYLNEVHIVKHSKVRLKLYKLIKKLYRTYRKYKIIYF